MNWFRVPSHIILMEPAEAAAWLWLLGMWHAGHTPRHNEIRRHLGWGAGRVQAFIPKVGKWASEAGASMPPEVAEQFRSSSGAVAEQLRSTTGAGETSIKAGKSKAPEQHRSDTGAVAEQQRSDSRAGDLLKEVEKREEEREKGEAPVQVIQGTQATVVIPAEPVVESPLVDLLSGAGLAPGQVAAVARKLLEAGIQSPTDEAAAVYDDFSLGNLVGNQHKGKVLPAFRRAGWLPPKERRQSMSALPPGMKIIDEKGNPVGVVPSTKAEKKAVETDDWFEELRKSVKGKEVAHGQ